MIKKATIPTIVGIIMLIIGSMAGVLLLKNTQIFKTGAQATVAAKNIRESNIADNSITITWTTDTATNGYLAWGTSEGQVDKIEQESSSQTKYFNHSITLSGLIPTTKYFYKIGSDDALLDNSGIPWAITTGPALSNSKNSKIISGNVINASGEAEKHALVYAEINGSLLSTVTSDTGYFVFQVGSVRSSDLNSFLTLDPGKTLVKLSVQAVPDGVASAQVFLQSANPVPPLIIGQTSDFRTSPANNTSQNPIANLSLPGDAANVSKFDVKVASASAKPISVILESISEGETITTTEPQFFGKAPEGTKLNITIHSDTTVTGSVTVPKTGSWSYTVPSNLSPGNHSITISWMDVSGITRFLTRDFVVQAAEAPAFTASHSAATASPRPTASPSSTPLRATVNPTASPRPNASITPIPTRSATARPTIRPTATPKQSLTPIPTTESLPVSGDLTPTLLLFIMSIAVLSFSIIVWKVAEE